MSIQTMINDASPGDTVLVPDGTYIERVILNKQLTLRAENQFLAFIQGGVTMTADGAWLEDFDITAPNTYRTAVANAEPEATTPVHDLTMKNLKIHNCHRGTQMWGDNNRLLGVEIFDIKNIIGGDVDFTRAWGINYLQQDCHFHSPGNFGTAHVDAAQTFCLPGQNEPGRLLTNPTYLRCRYEGFHQGIFHTDRFSQTRINNVLVSHCIFKNPILDANGFRDRQASMAKGSQIDTEFCLFIDIGHAIASQLDGQNSSHCNIFINCDNNYGGNVGGPKDDFSYGVNYLDGDGLIPVGHESVGCGPVMIQPGANIIDPPPPIDPAEPDPEPVAPIVNGGNIYNEEIQVHILQHKYGIPARRIRPRD